MPEEQSPTRIPEWATSVDHGLPESVLELARSGSFSPEFTELHVRLSATRLPHGESVHFHAHLGDALKRVYEGAAEALHEPLLPPFPAPTLDLLFFRERSGAWSPPIVDLDSPLWEALADGMTRHLGIEFRLIVRINAKWGVATSLEMTPRALLTEFGFDPAQFSLYRHDAKDPLPPDTPLRLHRGEHFEAQKDGRYGGAACPPVIPRGLQRIEDDVELMNASGEAARLALDGRQRFVHLTIAIPAPPWSAPCAEILIAVPDNYPTGGLDAFYLDPAITIGGAVPCAQLAGPLLGRKWNLVSWHYSGKRPWDPRFDDLQSHVAHCKGFFLKRGVVAQ